MGAGGRSPRRGVGRGLVPPVNRTTSRVGGSGRARYVSLCSQAGAGGSGGTSWGITLRDPAPSAPSAAAAVGASAPPSA